jgi:septum formation inhibitor MinC
VRVLLVSGAAVESDAMETTGKPRVTDAHGLLDSGEELATLAALASMLGCSRNALRALLQGPLRAVRWARREPEPTVYCVADARAGFEPHRAEIEGRRQQTIELERAGRAAKAARTAAANAPGAKPATKATPVARATEQKPRWAKESAIRSGQRHSPEVIVLARRPSTRP